MSKAVFTHQSMSFPEAHAGFTPAGSGVNLAHIDKEPIHRIAFQELGEVGQRLPTILRVDIASYIGLEERTGQASRLASG